MLTVDFPASFDAVQGQVGISHHLVSCPINNVAFVPRPRDRRPILIATKATLFMGQDTNNEQERGPR